MVTPSTHAQIVNTSGNTRMPNGRRAHIARFSVYVGKVFGDLIDLEFAARFSTIEAAQQYVQTRGLVLV